MAQQKESNGTWSFYGKLPKDENGKRKNYKRRGFKSKKAAKLAEAEFLKQNNESKKLKQKRKRQKEPN